MFGHDGPKPWTTKKGHSRLDREVEVVVNAQVKGEARASIEKVIQGEKAATTNKTEAV
jgi:hypothetical protein